MLYIIHYIPNTFKFKNNSSQKAKLRTTWTRSPLLSDLPKIPSVLRNECDSRAFSTNVEVFSNQMINGFRVYGITSHANQYFTRKLVSWCSTNLIFLSAQGNSAILPSTCMTCSKHCRGKLCNISILCFRLRNCQSL